MHTKDAQDIPDEGVEAGDGAKSSAVESVRSVGQMRWKTLCSGWAGGAVQVQRLDRHLPAGHGSGEQVVARKLVYGILI